MEIGNRKFHNFIWSLVLCICIVSGAAAPAYADDSTSGYSYYRAGSTLNPYTQQVGKNSADMIGRLLDVSSYNQSMIYNRLLQMSSSGADLTTVNSKITSIDSTLSIIKDSLGIGSSLNNVLSNQDSNLSHLNTIISQLHYWDNSHARSYEAGEMIFNIMNLNNDIVENTASIPAIKQDTKYIVDIYNKLNNYNGIAWSYIWRGSVNETGYLNSATSDSDKKRTPVIRFNSLNLGYDFITNTGLNFNDWFDIINKNIVASNSSLKTVYSTYRNKYYDSDSNSLLDGSLSYSIMDQLKYYFDNISLNLGKLQFVLANDDDIAARKANAPQQQTVLTNFTGSGSASASPSDFGAVKDSIVDFKAGFSGGASSSDTFSFMSGDSNAWVWFTQEIANDLDRTQGSNTRLLRGSSDVAYDTPLLDSYYYSILSILGGEN